LQQAAKLREADGLSIDCSMMTGVNNPDMALEWWNVNMAPYLKTAGEPVKMTRGILAPLLDGGGYYIQNTSNSNPPPGPSNPSCMIYPTYCINFKECLDNEPYAFGNVNAKSTFFLTLSGGGRHDANYNDREALLNACENTPMIYKRFYCTDLIIYDGWEIKDDYPW
jgi:hypothetical protein